MLTCFFQFVNGPVVPCLVFYQAENVTLSSFCCSLFSKFVHYCRCCRISPNTPPIKTSRVHYLLHFNVQINQWFFTNQLDLASFNINSKYIGSNLFSFLQAVKWFANFVDSFSLKKHQHSFLEALIPVNILAEPYLIAF